MKLLFAFASVNALRYREMFECIANVMDAREWSDYTVCGSNGVTYRRKWELDYHNCQHVHQIKVRNPGPCRGSILQREVANQGCDFCEGARHSRRMCGSDLRIYASMCELNLMNCLNEFGCTIQKTGMRKCKRLGNFAYKKPTQVYHCNGN